MRIFFIVTILSAFLLFPHYSLAESTQTTPQATQTPPPLIPESVQNQLRSYANKHIAHLVNNIAPCEKKKEVVRVNDIYQARYLFIDPESVSTHVKHDDRRNTYVGFLVYHEVEFACQATSRDMALSGAFAATKIRRIIEIVQYKNGRWK